MDDIVRVVIALANELAEQARGGAVDPVLVQRTKEATRRLYEGLDHLPPPLRRRAQRIVQEVATFVGTVERRFGLEAPPKPEAPPPPPPRAPKPAPPEPKPAVAAERSPAAQESGAARLGAFDAQSVRAGVIWAAILGSPRGVDPGW
ncbi:hypothetical protein EPN42_09040 [bacterium]|nr:MAG: hypothetical protein EPN42_09040 [bacterium]